MKDRTFEQALEALKNVKSVARSGWNGKNMYLFLVQTWESPSILDSTEKLPFIAMCTAQGAFVPWVASQTDMLADDWEIL